MSSDGGKRENFTFGANYCDRLIFNSVFGSAATLMEGWKTGYFHPSNPSAPLRTSLPIFRSCETGSQIEMHPIKKEA
jgi:hypothetical protein